MHSVHINDDWVLCEELLSFGDTVDHTVEGMAKIVMEVLKKFDLIDKLGCIVSDNASNNDTLCSSLSELIGSQEM